MMSIEQYYPGNSPTLCNQSGGGKKSYDGKDMWNREVFSQEWNGEGVMEVAIMKMNWHIWKQVKVS